MRTIGHRQYGSNYVEKTTRRLLLFDLIQFIDGIPNINWFGSWTIIEYFRFKFSGAHALYNIDQFISCKHALNCLIRQNLFQIFDLHCTKSKRIEACVQLIFSVFRIVCIQTILLARCSSPFNTGVEQLNFTTFKCVQSRNVIDHFATTVQNISERRIAFVLIRMCFSQDSISCTLFNHVGSHSIFPLVKFD